MFRTDYFVSHLSLLCCLLVYVSSTEGEAKALSEPLNLMLGYTQERTTLNQEAYATSQGGYSTLLTSLHKRDKLNLHLTATYRFEKRDQHSTPKLEMFDQQTMSNQGVNTFQRPQEATKSLAFFQRVSGGLQLEYRFDDHELQKQSSSILAISGGLVWQQHQQSSRLDLWGCVRYSHHWWWMESSYQSEHCVGQKQAHLRSLLGLYLGRAELGLGWGIARDEEVRQRILDGGLLGWVSLPLSAPLYLQMSFWFPQDSPLNQLYSVDPKFNDGRLFLVALSWTGETKAPEIEPPKPSPSTIDPQRQQPNRPNLNPMRPSQPTTPSTPL